MSVTVEQIEPGVRWRASVGSGASATAWIGQVHTTHAWLEADQEFPATVLRELAAALVDAAKVPVAAKAVPGTAHHAWLTEAGATAYQVVPPSQIEVTDPDNLAWAGQVDLDGAEVTDLTSLSQETVLDRWLGFYLWTHQDWSPVTDPEAARGVFAPMLADELDRERSVLVTRDGQPSAHGFVFDEGGGQWSLCCEAVAADSPHGPQDVTACLQTVIARLGREGQAGLEVDGHVSDPHLYPALQAVPQVTGAGLHLLHFQ